MGFEKRMRYFRKEWKQGKYRSTVRTASICVAAVCVAALGMYFFRGQKAEREMDVLRQARQTALEEEAGGDSLAISTKNVMNQYRDLFLQNPDLIGWLTIDGTKIDYPVMWTPEEPEFYSSRGFDKKESKNGLLFLDGLSNINEYGGNLIIYGHNMKNGSMFADLLKYEKQSYWEQHRTVRLDTLYESRVYEIAAVAKGNDFEQFPYGFVTASEEAATEAIRRIEDTELYDTGVDMRYGDDFLTLSTCDYSVKDGRLVVMARRVE